MRIPGLASPCYRMHIAHIHTTCRGCVSDRKTPERKGKKASKVREREDFTDLCRHTLKGVQAGTHQDTKPEENLWLNKQKISGQTVGLAWALRIGCLFVVINLQLGLY